MEANAIEQLAFTLAEATDFIRNKPIGMLPKQKAAIEMLESRCREFSETFEEMER